MKVSSAVHPVTPPLSRGQGLVAGAGAALALAATYWDDSWHTDKGRDEFAIPPHLLLYGGVLLASLAVLAWAVGAWRPAPSRPLGRLLGDPALLLAGVGGMTTLASAPLDNAWHEAYGRDAVLWSPPHLLAVAGTLALSVGVLAGLRATTGRGATAARLLAAAGVTGALQVPVLEYDSDVPQFSTFWYLPVAALGVCIAVALLEDLLPGRWEAARAAAVYTAVRVAVVGLLAVLGFSLTVVPPLVVLSILASGFASRPLSYRLVAVGALSPLVWWPVLRAQGDIASQVPAAQLPSAVILGAVAGAIVALLHGDWSTSRSRPALGAQSVIALALFAVTVVASPAPAWAHDPGQGATVVEGHLTVERRQGRAELTLELPRSCRGLTPGRVVARRAGQVRPGPVTVVDVPGGNGCAVRGAVAGLTPGRWFVYAELRDRNGHRLEAWLPVAEDSRVSMARPLYEPPAAKSGRARDLGGAVLLLVVAGLVAGCLRLSKLAATGGSVGRFRPAGALPR